MIVGFILLFFTLISCGTYLLKLLVIVSIQVYTCNAWFLDIKSLFTLEVNWKWINEVNWGKCALNNFTPTNKKCIIKPGVCQPLAGVRLVSWNCFCLQRQYVCLRVCVSAPEAIKYNHVIFNLYNQLNKFIAFRNVTKLSMHGRGHCCNEARHDRNQPNKAILAPKKPLVSLRGWF